MDSNILQPSCSACSIQLIEPYIECVVCDNINLCTQCFSKGTEILQHKSDHAYAVRKNNFPLFENCNWNAKDEFQLLKFIGEHGYGNWDEISRSMQTHSKLECQEHYKRFYIDNVQHEDLPILENNDSGIENNHFPYIFRESKTDDPPRQMGSTVTQQLAGYNPFRSDFKMNFDNNAESILLQSSHYDFEEKDDLGDYLQCSLVMAYNNRLRERDRRYNIIRRHGLIVVRKFYRWMQFYEGTLSRQTCERLAVFMQLLSAMEFDSFVESLSIEKELQTYLYKLYDFRKNGLKTFKGCHLYQNLKKKEDDRSKEFKTFTISSQLDWKSLSPSKSNSVCKIKNGTTQINFLSDFHSKISQSRKVSNPLEIIGLPGYDHLSEKEKSLCSSIRLVPENFILFRDILIAENNKNGCLRLLDARKLIKIDVNKTRKIYDLLVTEGFIKKPL